MRKNLKRGMAGPDVHELQETLNTFGYRLPTTGFFGRHTDEAVHNFQTSRALVSDGIVGWRTRKALGMDLKPHLPTGLPAHQPRKSPHPAGHPSNPAGPVIDPVGAASSFYHNVCDLARRIGCDVSDLIDSARKARAKARPVPRPAPPKAPAQAPMQPPTPMPAQAPGADVLQDVNKMRVSEKGLKFILKHETLKNVSNRLHHPTDGSGVTLGPGYDMSGRKPPVIERDLTAIGIDYKTVKKVAQASGYTSDDAENFANDNHILVNLTKEQEMKLLILVVPQYEEVVKHNIKVKLYQHQYDALICYAYNAGGGHTRVYKLLNQGKVAEAMTAMHKPNTSGGKFVKDLDDRRKDEIALFLYKNYGSMRG